MSSLRLHIGSYCPIKLGELEATYTRTIARSANLLVIMKGHPHVLKEVSELVHEYCCIETETTAGIGILIDDISADCGVDKGRDYSPEGDVLESFKSHVASQGLPCPLMFRAWAFKELVRLTINGVMYGSASCLLRGSFVIIKDTFDPDQTAAVQIQIIFTAKFQGNNDKVTYIAVKKFQTIESLGSIPPVADSYKTFDMGYLTSTDLLTSSDYDIIGPKQIVCPFVKTQVLIGDRWLQHVFPYNRVSVSSSIDIITDRSF